MLGIALTRFHRVLFQSSPMTPSICRRLMDASSGLPGGPLTIHSHHPFSPPSTSIIPRFSCYFIITLVVSDSLATVPKSDSSRTCIATSYPRILGGGIYYFARMRTICTEHGAWRAT